MELDGAPSAASKSRANPWLSSSPLPKYMCAWLRVGVWSPPASRCTALPCKVQEAIAVASTCRPFKSSHAATHPHIAAPAAMSNYWSKACAAQYNRPLQQLLLASYASCTFVVSMLRCCSRATHRIGNCLRRVLCAMRVIQIFFHAGCFVLCCCVVQRQVVSVLGEGWC